VAARTKRDQILLYIIAQAAARLDVVNFQAGCRAAELASPAVAL
jgi:hypothetical protein